MSIDEKFHPLIASGAVSILTAGIIRGRLLITPTQAAVLATTTVTAALAKAGSPAADQAVTSDPMVIELADAVMADIARRVTAQASADLAVEREVAMEIVKKAGIPPTKN